jgi:hypothetical protein
VRKYPRVLKCGYSSLRDKEVGVLLISAISNAKFFLVNGTLQVETWYLFDWTAKGRGREKT